MCKYQYKVNNGANSRKCNIQDKLESVKKDSSYYFELDFDNNGICLFHSENLQWKKNQKSFDKFEKLLDIGIQYNLSLDFSEFQFVADKESIVIKDKTISNNFTFKNCVFHDDFRVENVNVNKCAFSVEDSIFKKDFALKNSIIDTMYFFNVTTANFTMENVKVVYGAAMFNQLVCERIFKMSDCYFENTTDFNYAEFLDDRSGAYAEHTNVIFEKIKFVGEVDFSEAKFDGSVIFRDIDFEAGIKFIDTTFSFSKPLTFQNIKIHDEGIIQFRGIDEWNKIFNSEVRFYIKEDDIKGLIIFENVNFQNIIPSNRKDILNLQKNGKVEIGKGCIKYRHQTPIKSIEISTENQNLAIELANTFVQFFKSENGLNLGVEVVERNDNFIYIFYFSDADISYSEFYERLNKSEAELWQLVSVKKQSVQVNKGLNSFPERLLEGTDTIINLVGLILKIATRIPLGRINHNEMTSLFYTTSFDSVNRLTHDSINTININEPVILSMETIIMGDKFENISNSNIVTHSENVSVNASPESRITGSIPANSELKKSYQALVAAGKIQECLEKMLELFKNKDNKYALNEVIMYNSQFSQLKSQENFNTISQDDANKEKARLTQALIDFIDKNL